MAAFARSGCLVLAQMGSDSCRCTFTHTSALQILSVTTFATAGAKTCPPEGICTNCMPVNDTDKYTCWPIKTPIMYTLNSYGKLKAPRGREVDAMMSEIYANGPITSGVSCPEVSASLAIPRSQMLAPQPLWFAQRGYCKGSMLPYCTIGRPCAVTGLRVQLSWGRVP